jgi:hypothetical protein
MPLFKPSTLLKEMCTHCRILTESSRISATPQSQQEEACAAAAAAPAAALLQQQSATGLGSTCCSQPLLLRWRPAAACNLQYPHQLLLLLPTPLLLLLSVHAQRC